MKKSYKTLLLLIIDIILIPSSYLVSVYARFDGLIKDNIVQNLVIFFISLIVIKVLVYQFFGLYKNLWEYAGTNELIKMATAVITANTIFLSFCFMLQKSMPRSIFLLMVVFDISFVASVRFGYRIIGYVKRHIRRAKQKTFKRVMIIGAGGAGAMVIKRMWFRWGIKSV